MSEKNKGTIGRRNVIRTAATAGVSISGLSLLSGTSAAQERSAKNPNFEVKDGELVYTGPEWVQVGDFRVNMAEAVKAVNAAKRQGFITFQERGDRTHAVPTTAAKDLLQPNCAGQSDYENKWTWQGLRHIFWLDNCLTNEVRNKLIVGAALSEITALIAGYTGVGAPVAVISAAVGILAGAGATLLDVNNEGSGVKFYFHGPNLADPDIFEIMPQ